MEVFEVSVYVLIGLGTILAFVTYRLLSEDKRRTSSDVRRINAIYVFIIFFMVICQVVILDRFAIKEHIDLVNRDGFKITIEKSPRIKSWNDLQKEDTSRFVISRKESFSFEIPKGKEKDVRYLLGFDLYLKAVNFESNENNIESFLRFSQSHRFFNCVFEHPVLRPYNDILSCLNTSSDMNEYGDMLKNSTSTMVHFGLPVTLVIDEESKLPIAPLMGSQDTAGGVPKARNDLIFSNYFNIISFSKDDEQQEDGFNLANYFISSANNLVYDVEKIIADDKNILMASHLDLENIKLNQEEASFTVHRWIRLLEGPDRIYLIEIAYAPETDLNNTLWEQLKSSFESFRLHN